MGAKGYFNPRMKSKDFNKKQNEIVQKFEPKGGNKKHNSKTSWFKKRA
jgi:hypothetical protein